MKLRFPAKSVFLLLAFCVFTTARIYGQAGKDGARTVSSPSTVLNDYTTLTANVSAGASSIQVASSALSTNFSAPLAPGDLIFIIQMQGASMLTGDDSTYGSITSYNFCGNHEFAEVATVPNGTTITTACQLSYNYTAAGKTQIIRVPRFASLTINAGSSIIATAWNGSIGGAVVLEVQGATTMNGQIDVSARGFRAGSLVGDNNAFFGVLNWRWPTNDYGAEKGEGIAGSQTDYDAMNGRYCKGSPANGGGGASSHDAGGGGGANCGTLGYTGRGVPDVSTPTWANAWNLVYSGFAASVSSGGGEGGYSFSSSNQNATTLGTFSPTWGGDQRRDNGGRGGHPLDYSTGRIFLGGGGGAGDQNDLFGGAGGNGGGIVYLLSYGSVSGSGLINANGQNGFNTTGSGTDGAGGGGAGGTVILDVSGTIAGIIVSANGGAGGNQLVTSFVTEAEGPGGGGGGGYIAKSGGAIGCFANGGNNGTTNSFGLTEFPPNGATKGGAGMPNETVNTLHIIPTNVGVCAGSTATLTVTTTGIIPPGTVFNWYTQAIGGTSVGTGTTFTTPVINTGPVTYYVAACPGAVRYPVVVSIDNVTSSFTASSVCSGSATVFTGTGSSSAGTITGWSWNFGSGGNTSTQQNPSFTYPSAGSYTVTMTATSSSGCTSSSSQTVTVNTTPTISFTASPLSGCSPLAITFTNTSTNASSFTWDFGDGTVVFSSGTPSHTYTTPGTYSVTVTGTNGVCTSTHTTTNMITVNAKPLSSFSAPTAVCLGDPISFSNLSTGNGTTITGYTWNFGDGGPTSSSTNPSHTYASAGTYNVTLTANSSSCNDDTTITVSVNQAPVVAFTAPVLSGCDSLTVQFSNTTTGSPSYTWNFGDGSAASSSTNPAHTYTSSGTYTVTLIATLGSCADTLIRTGYIAIHHQPTSSFTATTVCQGDSAHFTNASTGNGDPITTYSWTFGDGGISALTNPAHMYSASGTYTAILAASTAYCTDYDTVSVSVTSGPVVNFSTPSTSGCGSVTAAFTNTTAGSPTYTWDFGDGSASSSSATPTHTYSTPGTYTVSLIAVQGSCRDTLVRPAYINVYNNPLSSFSTANVCLGDSVHFTNLSSSSGDPIVGYSWAFGDATTSSIPSASHYYSSAATYTVVLTASTAHCSDDTSLTVTVSPGPIANFSTATTTSCGPVSVSFTNTTTGTPTFTWNFGDGSATSSQTSPTHTYTVPGTYSVTLIASQGSCSDTVTRPAYITIYALPLSSFTTTNVCLGDTVHFTNGSSCADPITSYTWDFDDGTNGSVASPTHFYSTAGSYLVNLSIATAHCTDDTTITVTVSPAPVVNFSTATTSSCGGTAIAFSNTTTGSPVFTWNFGDGSATSSLATPTHAYTTAGTYTVTLIASQGSCGDTLVRSNYISIYNQPLSSFSTNAVCLDDSSRFTNLSTGNGDPLTTYAWDFDDGLTSSSISPAHFYQNAGSYNVTLTVSTAHCTDDTTIVVAVSDLPAVAFAPSSTTACDGATIQFTNSTTGSNTYSWDFGDGGSSLATSPSHTYTTPGVYTVTLTAAAAGGCSATQSLLNLITIRTTPVANFNAATTSICQNGCVNFSNQSGAGITSWRWTFSGGNPAASISQNPPTVCYGNIGNYNVTLIVSNGFCSDTLTQNSYIHVVNCSLRPTANFISSDTGLCGGACVDFVDLSLNSTGWQWQFPGATPSTSTAENPTSVCYSTPGTYNVTLITTNTTGSDTLVVSNLIHVSAIPNTPSFTQTGNVLTSTPASQYQWYYGNIPISGATSQQYTATLSGYYSVMTTDANGCSATSPQSHVSLVGIEEAEMSAPYTVYPNPAQSFLYVHFGQTNISRFTFELTNSLGQIVFRSEESAIASQTIYPINLEDLSAGVYFLTVRTEKRAWLSRIVH